MGLNASIGRNEVNCLGAIRSLVLDVDDFFFFLNLAV